MLSQSTYVELLVLYSIYLGQRLWNRKKTLLLMEIATMGEPWYLTMSPCLLVVVTSEYCLVELQQCVDV